MTHRKPARKPSPDTMITALIIIMAVIITCSIILQVVR